MACSKIIKDSKGAVLIVACSSLTLLFIICFTSCWILWFLFEKQKLQKICYNYTLKAQKNLIQSQEQLLSHNDHAWKLIIEKRILQKAIKSAPPKAKALLALRLRKVIKKQILLREKQLSILRFGKIKNRKMAFQLQKSLRINIKRASNLWAKKKTSIHLQTLWKESQVVPQFKEISPPYRRILFYQKRQTMGIRWKVQWKKLLPQGIREFVPLSKTWNGSCFSQPQKKGLKWHANISQDK